MYAEHLSDYIADNVLMKIKNINLGGCLIAAYSVLQFLRLNNCSDNFKLVCIFKDYYTYLYTKQFIKNKGGGVEVAFHYGWTFDNNEYYIDSYGMKSIKEYDYVYIIDNQEDIDLLYRKLINKKNMWNSDFDRRLIKYIEKVLQIELYAESYS